MPPPFRLQPSLLFHHHQHFVEDLIESLILWWMFAASRGKLFLFAKPKKLVNFYCFIKNLIFFGWRLFEQRKTLKFCYINFLSIFIPRWCGFFEGLKIDDNFKMMFRVVLECEYGILGSWKLYWKILEFLVNFFFHDYRVIVRLHPFLGIKADIRNGFELSVSSKVLKRKIRQPDSEFGVRRLRTRWIQLWISESYHRSFLWKEFQESWKKVTMWNTSNYF